MENRTWDQLISKAIPFYGKTWLRGYFNLRAICTATPHTME
jgi:hypothetical protein